MLGRLMRTGSGACRAEHQTAGSVSQGETQEGRGRVLGLWATNGPFIPWDTAGTCPSSTRVSTCEIAQVVCCLQESPAPVWMLRTGEIWGYFLITSCCAYFEGLQKEKALKVGHKIQPLVFLGWLLPLEVHGPREHGEHGLMGTWRAVLCQCTGLVVLVSSGHVPFRVPAPSLPFTWSLVQVYRGWLCHLHELQWQQTSPSARGIFPGCRRG